MIVQMVNLNKTMSPIEAAPITTSEYVEKENVSNEDEVQDTNEDGEVSYEYNNDPVRTTSYESKELGLEAFYYDTDPNTGEVIYSVVTNEGKPYLAKFLSGKPFDYPTYYKDDTIEWWKEYNENCEEVHYIDSTGVDIYHGRLDETDDIPLGEDWNVDKNELYYLAGEIRNYLLRMDTILQYYIETGGEMVNQINDTLLSMDSVDEMLEATNEHYTEASED